MCESKVTIREGDRSETAMEAAALIRISENSIICTDITGQEIRLEDMRISKIDLMNHEVILERGSR